ncbi:MAG TPA: DUF1761 domain-containing protein [Patescibacteria group bacterium]
MLNFWAVLVAAIITMVIGGLWYSTALFGKMWMEHSGMTRMKIEQAKKEGMGSAYVTLFIGAIIMAYMLAYVIQVAAAVTVSQGLLVASGLWLGFVATTFLGSVLFEKKAFGILLDTHIALFGGSFDRQHNLDPLEIIKMCSIEPNCLLYWIQPNIYVND